MAAPLPKLSEFKEWWHTTPATPDTGVRSYRLRNGAIINVKVDLQKTGRGVRRRFLVEEIGRDLKIKPRVWKDTLDDIFLAWVAVRCAVQGHSNRREPAAYFCRKCNCPICHHHANNISQDRTECTCTSCRVSP